MAQLTISELIRLGDISVPLSANYQANGALFGKRLAFTAPTTIAIVTDALRWQWDAFPDVPEVRAHGVVDIITTGDTGDRITVKVNDPFLGTISLGSYTLIDFDTTVEIIASNLYDVLVTNPYGYGISLSQNSITILAAEGTGAMINGHNNLYCVITNPNFLSTQDDFRLITDSGLNLITQ